MAEKHAAPQNATRAHAALSVQQLERVFGGMGNPTYALRGISFQVANGQFVAVMGPSGSGKTTLLNCISTIDKPTSGLVCVGGVEVSRLRGKALARFRREDLGFIFQDANLIETLTGYENIALALSIQGVRAPEIDARTKDVAKRLGVTDVMDKYPAQMSGGQRQRVAAARAIVGRPKLILADEPTGALDSKNSSIMLETLVRMNQSMGATILMVTHDPFAASHASRIIFVKDGKLFSELRRGTCDRKAFYTRILEVQALLGGESSHAC
ncbi:MAG: ABC transporter ATP-binding protein [Coriobacteriales bacterium]|nr:ABC transporter ATP-binding protein [Coriobacteriales bacterium]